MKTEMSYSKYEYEDKNYANILQYMYLHDTMIDQTEYTNTSSIYNENENENEYEIDDLEYGLYEDLVSQNAFMHTIENEHPKCQYSLRHAVLTDENSCQLNVDIFNNIGGNINEANIQERNERNMRIHDIEDAYNTMQFLCQAEQPRENVQMNHEIDTETTVQTGICRPMYSAFDQSQMNIQVSAPKLTKRLVKKMMKHVAYGHDDSEDTIFDSEDFDYAEYGLCKDQPRIEATYLEGIVSNKTTINNERYQYIHYDQYGRFTGIYKGKHNVPILIDNGATINIMPKHFYDDATYLHTLPKAPESVIRIYTGNGEVKVHFWLELNLVCSGVRIQFKVLVCESQARTGILMSNLSLEQLQCWQSYEERRIYIRQTSIPLVAIKDIHIPNGHVTPVQLKVSETLDSYEIKNSLIRGKTICWIRLGKQDAPFQPLVIELLDNNTLIKYRNMTGSDMKLSKGQVVGFADMRSKDASLGKMQWNFPLQQNGHLLYYGHVFASSLEQTSLATEDPSDVDQNRIEQVDIEYTEEINSDPNDAYPWLDKDDPRRTMTDDAILRDKVKLDNSEFQGMTKDEIYEVLLKHREAFSLRDEIGTCPYFEVHLKLRNEEPFFVRPYPIREEQKPVVEREMQRLEKLGIIKKGLTGFSSPVLLVKRKQQKLYRVVTDFRVLNERLVRINHAFPLVRDCLDAIGNSDCDILSVLDLRDAYHTLRLAKESQKYCGITPYYGSPTYYYLRMGMGVSASPGIWMQFVHLIWQELPNKDRYKIIMDDILIFSQIRSHLKDLEDLFKVLIKFGLKISPHKCQLFMKKLVYMGLHFMVKDGKACYTPVKDRCDAIRLLRAPKSVRECRQFCGMVNFLSTFLKDLRKLLIPIYELTRKRNTFNWSEKCQEAFNEIKKLLIKPPVLRMPRVDGKFRLESDTSREAAGGALYQEQDGEFVLIGYHSKRLPEAVRNYGVCELELTGLVCNIHGFAHLLKNNYFEVIIDHKAIEYIKKAKYEPTTRRLTMLLLKLQDYAFDIKYLEGSKLKVSDALSRLYSEEKHKITDVIPLNFLHHFCPIFIHHQYVNLGKARRGKIEQKPTGKRKRGRPRKTDVEKRLPPIPENKTLDVTQRKALVTPDVSSRKDPNELWPQVSGQMQPDHSVPSDRYRLVTKVKPPTQENYAEQRLAIPQKDDLSIFRRHIPKQKEVDAMLKNLRTKVLHCLKVNLDTKELIEEYPNSVRFKDIYAYIAKNKLPGSAKAQRKILNEASNYFVVNELLFKIEKHTVGKHTEYYPVLVIPEKYEPHILHMYHTALLAGHQGPWKTFLTMRRYFFMTNMLNKIRRYVEACHICQKSKPKTKHARTSYGRIPENYIPLENLAADIKYMPQGFDDYKFLLIATCEQTNFTVAIPLKERNAETIAEALVHRVFCIVGPPRNLSVDKDAALTGVVIRMVLEALECNLHIISPWNHGSSKAERQIQTIGYMITKQLEGKGTAWPLFAAVSAYAMNTFASKALQGLSPFELVFSRPPRDLTNFKLEPIEKIPVKYQVYMRLLNARAKFVRDLDQKWKTQQALNTSMINEMYEDVERFYENELVYLLSPHSSNLQTDTLKFNQDFVGPLAIDTVLDDTHYLLKDADGYKLPDVYHINRLKRGRVQTSTGEIDNYEDLRVARLKAATLESRQLTN